MCWNISVTCDLLIVFPGVDVTFLILIVFISTACHQVLSVTEEVIGIWQPMLSRMKMAEAYLRLVKVGKIIGIN